MDNIEDIKAELGAVAKFLEDGCFDGVKSDEQRNLIIELTVMKLREMAKEYNCYE